MENVFHEYSSFIIIINTNIEGVNQRCVTTFDATREGKFQKNTSSLIWNFVESKIKS
jgi:hypothetical protein